MKRAQKVLGPETAAGVRQPAPGNRGALFPRRFLIMLTGVLAVACAGLSPAYEGMPSRPENRIALEDAIRKESSLWRTRDLAIHYTAERDGDDLTMEGRVERLSPVQNFARIDNLRVTIHFIDPEGIIIDSRRLWSAAVGADARLVRWAFSQRYTLPPGATAFGFSYRGAFSDRGEEGAGQVDWEIWERP